MGVKDGRDGVVEGMKMLKGKGCRGKDVEKRPLTPSCKGPSIEAGSDARPT